MAVTLAGAAGVAWTLGGLGGAGPPGSAPDARPATSAAPGLGAGRSQVRAPPHLAEGASCADPDYAGDAASNALGLQRADDWGPFAPLMAREVGSSCPPESPGFARAVAGWRAAHALRPAGGTVDAPTLAALRALWNARRPFVRASAGAVCPPAAAPAALADAGPAETVGGKPVRLLPGALAAYRRMRADLLAALPGTDPETLHLVSGWRGPEEEAARCVDGSCDGRAKARCSPHRTGAAVDLDLRAPGAAWDDRAAAAHTPAYRWLVAHADGYGFLPYPFEPWHWEWTGGV